MINVEDIHSEVFIKKIFDKFFHDFKLDEIIGKPNKETDFVLNFFSHCVLIKYQNSPIDDNLGYACDFIKNNFSYDFVKYLLLNSKEYFSSNFLHIVSYTYPLLSLIQDISLTPWQWYLEEIESKVVSDVFSVLEKPKPFFDSRFEVMPISSYSYQGFNSSNWLANKKGSLSKDFDKDLNFIGYKRDKSSYRNIYIDAKIGFVFYFKDLPSIVTSFSFDNKNNLYIHQIQSQNKDRGHYKLGSDWRKVIIKYIAESFPNFNIFLIDGKCAANMVKSSYMNSSDVDDSTLDRITFTYDSLISNKDTPLIHKSTNLPKNNVYFKKYY